MPPPAPPGHAEVLADLDVAAAVGLMGAPAAEVPGWCTPNTADALRRSQARPWCLGCFSSLVISFRLVLFRHNIRTCFLGSSMRGSMLRYTKITRWACGNGR